MLSAEAGRNILNARTKAKLSRDELAARAEIATKTLQNMENGKDFKMDTFEAVSNALGISPPELLQPSCGTEIDLLARDPLAEEAVMIIHQLNTNQRRLLHIYLLTLKDSCNTQTIQIEETIEIG